MKFTYWSLFCLSKTNAWTFGQSFKWFSNETSYSCVFRGRSGKDLSNVPEIPFTLNGTKSSNHCHWLGKKSIQSPYTNMIRDNRFASDLVDNSFWPASCWTGTGEVQICLGLQDQGIEGTVKQGKVGCFLGVVLDAKSQFGDSFGSFWTDLAMLTAYPNDISPFESFGSCRIWGSCILPPSGSGIDSIIGNTFSRLWITAFSKGTTNLFGFHFHISNLKQCESRSCPKHVPCFPWHFASGTNWSEKWQDRWDEKGLAAGVAVVC